MTLDGHLLLSHPAEFWPACAPPECVCVGLCACLYVKLRVCSYCIPVFDCGYLCLRALA